MDISGKLVQVLPAQTGAGKNGPWKKCDFIIETADKFPKKICITAWGELADQIEGTRPDSEMKVSFDLSSREYNGKWYTDVKAWKIAKNSSEVQADFPVDDKHSSIDESQFGHSSKSDNDDLPFSAIAKFTLS